MIISLLFYVSQAKKRIFICNDECNKYSSFDILIVNKSNSNFNDYLLPKIKTEREIELNLYSNKDNFVFKIDLSYFTDLKVTIKTLSESKKVKIQINPFFKTIEIYPNFEIVLPDLIPHESTKFFFNYSKSLSTSTSFEKNIKSQISLNQQDLQFLNTQENNYYSTKIQMISDPEETPIPISVPIGWMTYTEDSVECMTDNECLAEIDYTGTCGKRCWTTGNNDQTFEYAFKGERFAIYGSKDPKYGEYELYLNNELITTINETDSSTQSYVLLYLSNVLEYNNYIIKTKGIGNIYEIYKFAFWPSIKARRINASEMDSTQTWNKERDDIGGFGEWTNNFGATKSILIQGSKVWVYGSEAWNHGLINIQFNDQNIDVDTKNSLRVDGKLIWESEIEPFNAYKIIVTNKNKETDIKNIYLFCIYYLYDPPSETSLPHPSMTPIPDTNMAYINKVFENYDISDQIQITANSNIKQISGCTFTNITILKSYFIRIDTEIPIFQNIFEYYNVGDKYNHPMPFWMNYHGKLAVSYCKFINCMHRSDSPQLNDGNVLNSNRICKVDVVFYSCEFLNCGNIEDRPIFGIYERESKLTLSYCNFVFTFNDNIKSSKILLMKSQDVSIDNCHFINTGEIRIENNGQQGSFVFTNNKVRYNHQSIISASDMKSAPTIKGNVFEDCDLDDSKYFISYTHSVDEIELVNNTFSSIKVSSGKQYGGSIAAWFKNNLQSVINLTYTDCHFINNENAHEEDIFNNGGVIQYGYSVSIASTRIIFENCEFKGNKCLGKGGALSFSTNQILTIINCTFEDNTASQGSTIYFYGQIIKVHDNQPDIEESKVESISIINCKFIENKGNRNVTGILIEEGNVKYQDIYIISCTFYDNGENNDQMLIQVICENVLFENNIVEYSNSTKSCGIIKINALEHFDLFKCTFKNCNFSGDSIIQIQKTQTNIFFVTIADCIFNDCYSSKYVISIQNIESISISDCTFNFSTNDNGCSGINIDSPNSISINNCQFEKCFSQNLGEACLYIHRDKIDGNDIRIELENILFDNCIGSTYNTIFVDCNCTYLSTIRNLTIQNIKNDQADVYIYGFNVNKDIIFEGCTFSRCRTNNAYGGGSGSRLIPLNKVSFIECTWKDNYCTRNGGAFQYGAEEETNNKILEFQKCNFTMNRTPEFGGAISIQTHNNVIIEGCLFNANTAGKKSSQTLNLQSNENYQGYGGSIYIDPQITTDISLTPVYTITGTNFVENQGNDGHAIFIVDSQYMTVSISDNVFTDNGQTGSTIVTDQIIDIGDSTFNKTQAYNKRSNLIRYTKIPAIYEHMHFYQQFEIFEEQNEGRFYNCTFFDCGFDQSETSGHQYIIKVHCNQFTFDNSTIEFEDPEQACGGICIDCYCNVTIINSYFYRCNVKEIEQSAGIYYKPKTGNDSEDNFKMNFNTFGEMAGVDFRCFYITTNYNNADFSNNIIQNSPEGGTTGYFCYYNSDICELNGWQFLHNKANALFSGGCGLFISPMDFSENTKFIFSNCIWQNNEAIHDPDIVTTNSNGVERVFLYNGLGGAIQIGSDEPISKLKLEFNDCEFKNNSAAFEGGALAIQTTKDCTIQNCTFEYNKAGTTTISLTGSKTKSGGAIFIDPDFINDLVLEQRNPQISIIQCKFKGNKDEDNGSAIFLRGLEAKFTVEDNTFSNNQGSNNVFYSSCLNLCLSCSQFMSTDSINTSAIELVNGYTYNLESIIIEGFKLGGIKMNAQTSSTYLFERQKYELNNCTFKECGSSDNKGGCIYADDAESILINCSIFDNCFGEGSVAYIGTNVNSVDFSKNSIINMNTPTNFMIVSGATSFLFEEKIIDKSFNNFARGFKFIGGTNIIIENMFFEGLTKAILIDVNVSNALIENCTFLDCPSRDDFVTEIKNKECNFINNTIVFSEDHGIKGRGIKISNTNSFISIKNCIFKNNYGDNVNGNAIYIETLSGVQYNQISNTIIESCIFENCGTIGWAVYSLEHQFTYSKNTITYTSNALGKGGGGLYAIGGTIENNTFENTFKYAGEKGNALTIRYAEYNSSSYPFKFNYNTFIKCNGDDIRCFDLFLQYLSDYSEFKNITVRDSPEALALTGTIEILNPFCDYIEFSKCNWINNTVLGRVGGGCGLSIKTPNSFDVYFEGGCLFENNTAQNGKGGALQIGYNEEPSRYSVYIRSCKFINNEASYGGAIAIETTNSWIIESQCTFEKNKVSSGGGAIYVNTDLADKDEHFTGSGSVLRNCNFTHNESPMQGTILYFTPTKPGGSNPEITIDGSNVMNKNDRYGYLIYSAYQNLVINNLDVSGESIETQELGFLSEFSDGKTTLNNCQFTKIGFASSVRGNVICIDGLCNLELYYCSFLDCVSNSQKQKNFIIFGSSECGKTFVAEKCVFNFTSTNLYSTAICIDKYAHFILQECSFTNCWSNNQNRLHPYPGAIRYGPNLDIKNQYKDKTDFCYLVIRGCTFDNCNYINGPESTGRVIHGYGATQPVLINNTIKNTVDGGYIFSWEYLIDNSIRIILDEFRFENNKASCKDGGGSGIYIANAHIIKIENCYFIKNELTKSESNIGGGGFSFGNSTSELSKNEIQIHNCYFEDNSVPSEANGGSLYISSPYYQTIVSECIFSETRDIMAQGISKLGGAIYITQNQGGVTIDGCNFTHVHSSSDGNAICIDYDTSIVTIRDCKFTDCHYNKMHSVILSYGNNLAYIHNVIEFSDITKASRGIMVYNPSQVEICDSNFYNCVYNEHGCGFALNTGLHEDNIGIESITIKNTILYGCSSSTSVGPKQSAIYLGVNHAIIFECITIQNSNPTSNCNIIIFETPYNVFIEEQTINKCNFINCSTKYEKDHRGGIGFEYNKINNLVFLSCNFSNLRTTGFGGAVALNDPDNNPDNFSIEFQDCEFYNNSVTGNDVKGSSLYINVSFDVTIKNCNFTHQSLNGYGGSIYVENSSFIFMENNGFYSTETDEGNGNAIYLSRGLPLATIVNNNRFVDCGTSSIGSVIESGAKEFIFSDNTIQFSKPYQGTRGIFFPCQCTVNISYSTISGCNSKGDGGGIWYRGDISNQPEFIHIERTVFENNNASNGCALLMKITSLPNITSCVIEKHISGEFIFCIFIQKKLLGDFQLEKCTFKDNYFKGINGNGGGSGIFISAPYNVYDEPYQIGFNSCIFKNNKVGTNGGAIGYGNSGKLKEIMFCFYNCEFTENSAEGEKGGAIWLITEAGCTIDSCIFNKNFISNSVNKFGHAIYADESANINIQNTTFTNCGSKGSGSVIFYEGRSIHMENSTIKFTEENDGSIGFEAIVATNIELIDNRFIKCHSTECGGAIHLPIINDEANVTELVFDTCTFTENTAEKSGSAIYLNETSSINDDLEIINCTFNKNKATHHGGAIFIENIKSITINGCLFKENSAHDSYLSSTEAKLLFEKLEGRGGAIFINPSLLNLNENNETDEIVIENCTFLSNSAYDGYGIYIEGYGQGESIIIKENTFKDNHKSDIDKIEDIYSVYRSVISSEIVNLYSGKVITENSFNNDESNRVIELMYVDHYGVPILPTKTPSNHFTISNFFTSSGKFSKSIHFTSSGGFSGSRYFTTSEKFTESQMFSLTHDFSTSNEFTKSKSFSPSCGEKTESQPFSSSQDFTKSNDFSVSEQFNESLPFSQSEFFSLSSVFEPTHEFTKSNEFTKSDTFTSSSTFEITPSRSSSSVFSSEAQMITVSKSVSLTFVIRKSISYSVSYFASNTISISYNEQDNTYVVVSTETSYMRFFPYIIHYLSPSYVPTFITLVVQKRKSITKEQLIGITCGGASVSFLVLGIIILVIKRRNENKQIFDEFEDISYLKISKKKKKMKMIIYHENIQIVQKQKVLTKKITQNSLFNMNVKNILC